MKKNFIPRVNPLIARITLCLTVVAWDVGIVPGQGQDTIISFKKHELTVGEVIATLQRHGSVSVAYNDDVHPERKHVVLPQRDMRLAELINQLERQAHLDIRNESGSLYLRTAPQEQVTLSGRVMAGDLHEPLPAAYIMAGDRNVSITDANGNFSFAVETGTVLHFSYIGYMSQEYTVQGAISNLEIVLPVDVQHLDEVVVTALNISREERSLGYATQKLGSNAVNDAPSKGIMNALSGKVAGLNLLKADGPMGSTRVTLRGESILSLSAPYALIVVDGVPINTSFSGAGHGAYLGGDSPIDFGSALTDIDPNNIESMNVLKGPAAAALYGSRAGAGVIIITTKGADKKKGLGVTLNSSVSIDRINRWPDYQYEYGQGTTNADYYSYGNTEDGPGTHNTSSAWGPRFEGQSFYQYNSPKGSDGAFTERTPWVAYPDNRKDFFRQGITTSNSLAFSYGGDKGDSRLSISHLKNEWILPNTGYERISVAMSNNTTISNKLKFSTRLNYYNKYSDNLPTTGYNNQSIMYFIAFQNPNINLDWYKPHWLPGKEGIEQNHPFSSLIDNPYLIVNEMLNKSNRHNITGKVSVTYEIVPRLELRLSTGLDAGYEFRSQQRPMNTQKFQQGMYRQQTIFNYESNSDFLLSYNFKPAESLVVTASAGGNAMIAQRNYTNQLADQLRVSGVYNLANSLQQPTTQSARAEKRINSFYGFVNVGYRDFLFLDLTARNDWTSTLPPQNNSYFYPSAALSFVFSEVADLPQWVSFGKLRTAFASVGNDAPLASYGLERAYNAGTFPGELQSPSTIANPDLKPQRSNAWEAGMEWKLFNNRLSFDATVYYQSTIDQILEAPVEYAAGYSSALINFGEVVNRGIEVTLGGSPIRNASSGFTWDVLVNWAMNRNEVTDLEGRESVVLAKYVGSRVTIEAREGRPMGDIYGLGYKRSPDGQIVYDNQGYPELSDEFINHGNSNPQWRGSLTNTFRFKGLSLSVMLDRQQGGRVYSLTNSVLGEQGKIKSTLPGRYDGIVGAGVMLNAEGQYVPNTTVAVNVPTYYSRINGRDNVEANVFDATYTKLREVRLSYALPGAWLSKTFLREASIGVFGRDLYTWSDFPAFDPETATLDNSTVTPGLEIGQFPSTRTMGVNLQISF
jgi:TonB-linked SusC/RagA family outer membrane protein